MRDDHLAVLLDALGDVDRRGAGGQAHRALARTKSLGVPLVLASIDEVQRAFEHRELGKELEEVLTDLVKVAPAVGVMFCCSTQKPG